MSLQFTRRLFNVSSTAPIAYTQNMTELLEKAFKKISEELPEFEQDAFAQWLLKLIEDDERQWDAQFAASAEKLETLGNRALTEYAEGRTETLDLAKLSKP